MPVILSRTEMAMYDSPSLKNIANNTFVVVLTLDDLLLFVFFVFVTTMYCVSQFVVSVYNQSRGTLHIYVLLVVCVQNQPTSLKGAMLIMFPPEGRCIQRADCADQL